MAKTDGNAARYCRAQPPARPSQKGIGKNELTPIFALALIAAGGDKDVEEKWDSKYLEKEYKLTRISVSKIITVGITSFSATFQFSEDVSDVEAFKKSLGKDETPIVQGYLLDADGKIIGKPMKVRLGSGEITGKKGSSFILKVGSCSEDELKKATKIQVRAVDEGKGSSSSSGGSGK